MATEKQHKPARIIYSRGFPYGAPLVMLRGKGTYQAREFLKEHGFRWNPQSHAWEHYMNRPELGSLLVYMRDVMGFQIDPKEGMDANYLLDLDEDYERFSNEPQS